MRVPLAAWLLAAAVLLVPAAASASMLPGQGDLPGLVRTAAGARVAAVELASAQPAPLRRVLDGARREQAGFRAGPVRLSLAAYVTANPATARRLLSAWVRARRAARIPLGDGSAAARIATRTSRVHVVVVRIGSALGVVRLEAPRADAGAAVRARGLAELLAATIEAELARGPWEALVDGALEDGEVSRREALEAFALAYGGLPGFPETRGEREPVEGSLALRWILRVRDQLTPAQQQAVAALIDDPLPPVQRRLSRAAALTFDAARTAEANGYAQTYLGLLGGAVPGGVLPFPIRVYRSSANVNTRHGWAAADAATVDERGRVDAASTHECRIRLMPLLSSENATFRRFVVAHEVFHCVQFAILGPAWPYTPDWIMEGTPDWAAQNILQVPFGIRNGGDTFAQYLHTPAKQLFRRAYDAVGFFGAADQHTGNLWPRMRDIVTGSSDSAFAAAGGTDAGFLETWASGLVRLEPGRVPWFVQRPWAVAQATVSTPKATISGNTTINAPDHANRLAKVVVPSSAPLVEIAVTNGPARVNEGDVDIVLRGSQTFCARGQCVCPPGEVPSFPPFIEIGSPFALALTGATSGSSVQLRFRSKREFCRPDEQPGAGRTPTGPAGGSNGDPHMTTLDGLRYDLQAAGEFVLVRSGADLEVQARQEPWEESKLVTVNTQIAVKLGSRRVTVKAGEVQEVHVGGTELAIGDARTVSGGSVQRISETSTVVRWPDGSVVFVYGVGRWGLAVSIQLAEARRGTARGLLGNFDGNLGNDLVDRSGRALAYTVSPFDGDLPSGEPKEERKQEFLDALYDRVGESWRVRPAESLLRYGPGQTTATFTDRSIPTRRFDDRDVGPAARRRAEQICRAAGVSDPGLLENCILDVAVTGEQAFAEAIAREQELAPVAWRRLAWGTDLAGAVSLVRAADGTFVAAARERSEAGAVRIASVRLAADGSEEPAAIVGNADGEVQLSPAPDGSLLATAALIDPATGESGTFGYAAPPPYSLWGARRLIGQGGFSYVGNPSSLVLGEGTPLTVSPTNGANARLFRGFAALPTLPVTPFSEPIPDLPDCYASAPALASDGAETWLAWLQWDCPLRGLYVARVDPGQVGTDAGIQVATRALAPRSFWPGEDVVDYPGLGLSDRVALAARAGQPGTFVAYTSHAGGVWRVLLWRIGQPEPIEVARSTSEPRVPRLVAEPTSGRLWVAWQDGDRLRVRVASADGATFAGPARAVDPPSHDAFGGRWALAATDGALVIVHALDRAGSEPGAVWIGTLAG